LQISVRTQGQVAFGNATFQRKIAHLIDYFLFIYVRFLTQKYKTRILLL
jgi:hypothetical protein